MSDDDRVIADALGKILSRGFRVGLYADLTDGVARGLNESTYPVFSALVRADAPVGARDIAREVGTDRSVVSRRAATLMSAGLVEPVPGADSRAVYFTLTEHGRRSAAVMRERLDAAIARHLAGWSDGDVRRFAALFSKFSAQPLPRGTNGGLAETRRGEH
ncbi:MarR family winged helix-turn-helix transcriptional regulator [Gordonia sp. HY442]|uniref:MarR family winged helix-turn-helix transcriptional regulator n=1 Tax=Gordonia zhenghanii TaxID=2911516 RepID=UPI001F28EF64|nr:MarR family winged helix-turn-helix transcriptional regulator [Gordonia zhenghanii]MCF8604245.1 MarR family winged helix-turn-helix transcriptional regulator [Gordonia zhenghanii]